MGGYSFQIWWLISLVALLALAVWIGRQTKYGALGILIDTRGRYSLTHFQTVLWTIVILSSILGLLISSGFDAQRLKVPPQLLGLMGISAGSAVAATAVKAAKDAAGSRANVARTGPFKEPDGTSKLIEARFAQIWLVEEGDQADEAIDITKFQNFIFTLVILAVYITAACKSGTLPVLDDNVVWLIGISHAGYVGGKIPNKPKLLEHPLQ